MKLITAGLLVWGGLMLLVALAGATGVIDRAPTVTALSLAGGLIVLVAIAQWLFNRRGTKAFGRRTKEEYLRELEALDLIESADFRATRAFGVEEAEDEGLHYYLELEDGRVLFLSGQYLYDSEPITDDPGGNQPRLFPCTDFTVRRHKKERYVVELQCRGRALEPEAVAHAFHRVAGSDGFPQDGELIADRTYDEVKRTCLA
jgi:hypothetical protein